MDIRNPFTTDSVKGHDHSDGYNGGKELFPSITFVMAKQSEDVPLDANTPEAVPFNEVEEDNLGEFSGGQFTPSKTAWYDITFRAEFAVGSDQDELKLSVHNADEDETVTENEERASGSGNRNRELDCEAKLTKGTSYEFLAENTHSQDTISGKPKRTRLNITEELVKV
jgi:hypothetical protein